MITALGEISWFLSVIAQSSPGSFECDLVLKSKFSFVVRSNVAKDVSDVSNVSITVQPYVEARCTKWTLGLETAV